MLAQSGGAKGIGVMMSPISHERPGKGYFATGQFRKRMVIE